MKFRRIVSIALILCMLFSFASCSGGAAASKKVVSNLMTALATYDAFAIAKCVEDMPDNSGTAYVHDIYTEDYYKDLYALANQNLSYTVASASAKEVVLNVKMPDLYSLYEKVYNSVLAQTLTSDDNLNYVLNNDNDAQVLVIALMIKDIEDNGIATVDKQVKLSISKINDSYKVNTDDQLKLLLSDGLSLARPLIVAEQADAE
jgi:hypothetical protein